MSTKDQQQRQLREDELDAVSGGAWSEIFDSISAAAQAVSPSCPACERAVAVAANAMGGFW